MPARSKKKSKKIAAKTRSVARSAVKGKASAHRPARGKPSATRRALSKTKPAKKAARPKPVAKKRDRETAQKKREREAAQKKREREAAQKKRQREAAEKKRQREAAEKKREHEAALRSRVERERVRKREARERERQRALRNKERERTKREKEREREKKARQKELAKKERAAALARLEREKARAAERQARETERQRQRDESRRKREEERARREAERERAREEARRVKEEERAKREAEREAYRKAKEAERERLRAEREAARRALEGRVARATKRAQRAGAGRATTTRVYRPDAIPDQSGTRRQLPPGEAAPTVPRPPPLPLPLPPAPPPPPAPAPKEAAPEAIEERYSTILKRLSECEQSFRNGYTESFDMSWIYHDSALEGVVYTYQELKTAIDPSVTVVPDSSLQPVCDEIRRHKQALELVRELGEKKRVPITVDTIKKIYLTLHPEEGDLKSVKYRKDIPQHRLYFHEYAPPDKIAYKVRQVVDWLNGPEPKKIKNPIRVASRVHYDLLRIFPFSHDSGKVARLLANVILLRSGHPPAIIHSTERQRYYEALKSSLPTIVQMVTESINNGLMSVEKRLDERETRVRSFGA